ncbi:MAG: hypothetical protein IJ769_05920 [Clostridia bacterium]|nr:hypothetical protein [Clostridia bacterium]
MQLRHRVALNGAQLDELDERILVAGVEEGAAKESVSTVSRFGGAGQRVTACHRDTLDVVVRFGLRVKPNDMAARSELFELVMAWATNGGWLTVSYKPNRRLWVRCAQLPAAGDLVEWTSEYAITFRAYGVPYWQRAEPIYFSATGIRTVTRLLEVPGSADTVLDVSFVNLSGMPIAAVSISAGDSRFALQNLGLAADEALVIDHTAEGLLRMRIRAANGAWRSAMASRTTESSDDLRVSPGQVNVGFTAQRAGLLTVSCYGRYA